MTDIRIALDSNVLDYAEACGDAKRYRFARDLAADHESQIWDALIMSVAADQHCRLWLSEELQHGFTWRGVTVVNPFVNEPAGLLEACTDMVRAQ